MGPSLSSRVQSPRNRCFVKIPCGRIPSHPLCSLREAVTVSEGWLFTSRRRRLPGTSCERVGAIRQHSHAVAHKCTGIDTCVRKYLECGLRSAKYKPELATLVALRSL
eukprot:6187132-Pleurochrysis_carterae.AAC.2